MVDNKKPLFQKKYSFELYSIGKSDLETAAALIQLGNPGRVENTLYMIQQSVEKTLKSVLIYKQIPFPLVHDLGILIALLPSSEYPPGGFDWSALNPYASIRRYEEGSISISNDEVIASYDAALLVIAWAQKILS